jgi:hypothetical protein
MACDHLNIHVEYLHSLTPFAPFHGTQRFTKQDFLLFSPSTVKTLCEELSHHHSLPLEAFVIYHNGMKLSEKQRIVDRYTYHVQIEVPKGTSLHPPVLPLAEKSVHFDSEVYIDPSVEIVSKPIKPLPIYFAFYHQHITYLLDQKHGAILSPHPRLRIGHCVVYVDWSRFQPALLNCPATEPMAWMYDRLQRDFGITGTSSVFGIQTAPLSQIQLYHSIVKQWTQQRASLPLKEDGGEEGEEGEEDGGEESEESEEGEESEEERIHDVLDDIEYYVDDSEMWR